MRGFTSNVRYDQRQDARACNPRMASEQHSVNMAWVGLQFSEAVGVASESEAGGVTSDGSLGTQEIYALDVKWP